MGSSDLLRKLRGFYRVNDDLPADFEALARERVKLSAGQTLVTAGERFSHFYLVESGWLLRTRHLPGGGRQIVNIALPGDFLCYSTLMFERADYDVVAKTDAVVCRLQGEDFRTMMERHKGLAEALLWTATHEEALLAERVVSLGRRDATQRLAHVLCEIAARLSLIERYDGKVLSLPLIQEDFADILGLSIIHVSRTFTRLSQMGAVDYRSRKLILLDMAKLRHIAGFEDEYLHFTQRRDARSLTGHPKER